MKERSEKGSFSDREWKEIASSPSEINVDRAWNRLHSRLVETGNYEEKTVKEPIYLRSTFLRIAAAALILLGIGGAAFYLAGSDALSRKIVFATGAEERSGSLTLPDGSNIWLNHSTSLTYHSNFGKHSRKVILSGEAFFDIAPDASRPFVIDAGEASVKVVGTSFNVITRNTDSAVEVFVKTGKVMLSDNSGSRNMMLEPGYIGTMDSKISGRKLNDDPNYLSWNTGRLVYDGQKLETVFRDLRKIYNMEIVADDKNILDIPWTVVIDNKSQETIISLICGSFNLSYSKDGNVFHLSKK